MVDAMPHREGSEGVGGSHPPPCEGTCVYTTPVGACNGGARSGSASSSSATSRTGSRLTGACRFMRMLGARNASRAGARCPR